MFSSSSVCLSICLPVSISTWFPLSKLNSFLMDFIQICVHMYISGGWLGLLMGKFVNI